LQRGLKVVSLTDAFFEERPSYRGSQGISPRNFSSTPQ
jgi:hypothetical protein